MLPNIIDTSLSDIKGGPFFVAPLQSIQTVNIRVKTKNVTFFATSLLVSQGLKIKDKDPGDKGVRKECHHRLESGSRKNRKGPHTC